MMAQLIKLKDYVSRYEWDPYRYPSQFIRIKQEQWNNLYQLWGSQDKTIEDEENNPKDSRPSFLKSFIKNEKPINEKSKEILPATTMELKQYFLDKLFPLQLKWATSTVTDVSFIDKTFQQDDLLKYFIQRFPDIYFVMYYPTFCINNIPVDGEIILISPFEVEVISLLEVDKQALIMAGGDRTWTIVNDVDESKIINPFIALKRTEHLIRSILHEYGLNFPIQKSTISRTNHIVYSSEPYLSNIVGKLQFNKWFTEKRKLTSTLKSQQLKVVEILLKHCLTNSVKRPEWEEEPTTYS